MGLNRRPFEIAEGGFVGSDHARARAGLDAHVAQGHAAFHGERANRRTRILDHAAAGAVGSDVADDAQRNIFRRHCRAELAVHRDAEGFGARLRQALGGQNVLHFRSADAEGQRAESAMGAGVAVAANDGHARLGNAELRADHMHDPLFGRLNIVEWNAELGAVGAQGIHLFGRDRIFDDEPVGRGGDVMVHRGDRPVRAAHGSSRQAKPFKRLRRSDFMQQMQIDIQQRRLAFRRHDHMRFPNLFKQRFCALRHMFSLCCP